MLVLEIFDFDLLFKKPFAITHGIRTHTESLYIKLSISNYCGWGEATLPPYLKENRTSVKEYIIKNYQVIKNIQTDKQIWDYINQLSLKDDPPAAKTILEMALFDLLGHMNSCSVRELLNLPTLPLQKYCSYTICFSESIEEDRKNILEAKKFKRLKFKFTSMDDLYKLDEVSDLILKTEFSVDANQGVFNFNDALKLSNELYKRNCQVLEQPLPIDNWEDAIKLKTKSPLPIFADESFSRNISLSKIANAFHGINVKTIKIGGLIPSLRAIEEAMSHGLLIQVGCMSESSLACSYALNLVDHANLIDLDGPLLIKNDPFEGLCYSTEGQLSTVYNIGIGSKFKSF